MGERGIVTMSRRRDSASKRLVYSWDYLVAAAVHRKFLAVDQHAKNSAGEKMDAI
jgi:hypothetical protein